MSPAPDVDSRLRILGIDPGTATTGFGVVDGPPGASGTVTVVDYGVIRTAAGMPMPRRLLELYTGLSDVIRAHRPDVLAVEELFFSNNVTTALTVGQARGVILLAGVQANLPVFEYKPLQVKQALTGYGGADKRQMQAMLRILLGLADIPRPDDAADAIAIALCHLQTARAEARWRTAP